MEEIFRVGEIVLYKRGNLKCIIIQVIGKSSFAIKFLDDTTNQTWYKPNIQVYHVLRENISKLYFKSERKVLKLKLNLRIPSSIG